MSQVSGDLPNVPGYTLERILGEGGMGRVYLGRSASGRRVAVKVIRGEVLGNPAFRSRFRQEVAAARQVSGAFTAPVLDADPDAEPPWMVTQFISGPSLDQRVKAGPQLTAQELRQLAAGLAEALRDIHRAGIVHRDLKPSNVLLAEDSPRVIDFGIVRAAEPHVHTQTGIVMGTPPFMSPEQVRGSREMGPASDIFSFGSVMVYAAAGHPPFPASDLYAVAYQLVHDEPELGGVPDWLRPVLARCLAKDPADRPTAAGLLGQLTEPGAHQAPTVPPAVPSPRTPIEPTPSTEHTPLPRGTRRVLASAAAVAATATLTSAVLYGVLIGSDNGKRGTAGGAVPTSSASRGSASSMSDTPQPPGASTYAATQSGGPAYTYAYTDTLERRPKGWKAWESSTSGLLGGISTCVYAKSSLLCVGDATIRIDAATGRSLWTKKTVSAYGQNTPAVVGGLAIVNDGDVVRGLSLADGKEQWRYSTANLTQRLTADDRNVYVAEHGGQVHAVDAATGKGRWTARPSSANNTGQVPAIRAIGGRIYVFSGAGDDPWGNPENLVTVLDAASGRRLAEHRLRQGCVLGTEALTEESGTTVLYCAVRSAAQSRTGVLRWPVASDGTGTTTWVTGNWGGGQVGAPELSVSPGRAYLVVNGTGSSSLVAVDPVKRSEVWRTTIPGASNVDTPPLHAGGRLYMAYNGGVAVFDPVSGKRLWHREIPTASTDFPSASEPLIAGGIIFLLSQERGWLSLDTERG
jgi:serine/threonine protein kinase